MSGALHLQGVGKVAAVPDTAQIAVSIESRKKIVTEGLKDSSTRVKAFLDAVEGLKIDKNKIKTTSFSVRPVYKTVNNAQTDQIEYWSVTNAVNIRVPDTSVLGELLSLAGQNGSVEGPWFSCSNQTQLEDTCREIAMKDAMRKAEIYCKSGGLKVKNIVDVIEHQSYVHNRSMAIQSCAAPMGGAVPVESGEQSISITIGVQFAVESASKSHKVAEEVIT